MSSHYPRPVTMLSRRAMLRAAGAASLMPALPARALALGDDPAMAAIDALLRRAVADGAVVGMVFALARRGRADVVRAYGMADLESERPMDVDAVFRIGSLTKMFTATAILLLVEQGALDLEDRLVRFFPDFPGGEAISIRHLLQHLSGIRDYVNEDFLAGDARRSLSETQMVSRIATQSPLHDFAPGTGWRYSNSGYYLLGAIIGKVAAEPYGSFLRRHIFAPLGMEASAWDEDAAVVRRRVRGYDRMSAGQFRNAPPILSGAAGAAGGLRATAGDLLRWNRALHDGGILPHPRWLSMIRPALLADGRLASEGRSRADPPFPSREYGMGLMLGDGVSRAMIGHGGSINGFNAILYSYPDIGTSMLLLTNTGGAAYGLAPAMAALVHGGPLRREDDG